MFIHVLFSDDFKEQVKRSLNLPANYSTVFNRAQLAQKIYEKAKDEIRICETLVYEQHLQQQGCKYHTVHRARSLFKF